MALHSRWQEAAECYSALIKIDQLDTVTQIGYDYHACGVVLTETGDRKAYDRFWQMAATNFAATTNSSVLLACILQPLNASQIGALPPMEAALKIQMQSLLKNNQNQWLFVPFALGQYRCGDYDTAIEWSQPALKQNARFPACAAELHFILAMADFQRGRIEEAGSELALGRQLVDARFKIALNHEGNGGFWWDWIYVRHLMQEASTLIESDSPSLKRPEIRRAHFQPENQKPNYAAATGICSPLPLWCGLSRIFMEPGFCFKKPFLNIGKEFPNVSERFPNLWK